MDTQLIKYKSLRDVINKMLFWSGIYPHLEDTTFYYRIITFTAVLMCSSNGAKIVGFCLTNVSKMTEFVRSISSVFSMYTLLLKVFSFILFRKDLLLLDTELGRTFEEELENKDNRHMLLQGISVYMKILYTVSGLTALAALVFYNVPLLHVFMYKKYDYIYEGNYPFTVIPASPLYWTILFYEASSIWFTFNVTNGVDNAFGLHCFRVCGLLRLVAQRWEQIQLNNSKSKQQIRECVRMHQLVIRSKDSLQRVYGFIVLWHYVTISLIICSLLWQADQMKKDMTLIKVVYFTCYITLKSLQAFIYAYYGSLVSEESENYQEAIYTSGWPGSGNVKMMKDILIVYTQRIITLKAFGYFLIKMEMFEKILNTSLSYFFLLLTVESKN